MVDTSFRPRPPANVAFDDEPVHYVEFLGTVRVPGRGLILKAGHKAWYRVGMLMRCQDAKHYRVTGIESVVGNGGANIGGIVGLLVVPISDGSESAVSRPE